MDIKHNEQADMFPILSNKVMAMIRHTRDCLFGLDEKLAQRLCGECAALASELRKAEADCNTDLLVGISCPEDRLTVLRYAQQCSRLGRIVHQAVVLLQNVQDVAKDLQAEEVLPFKPIFLMAEMELKDAVLSIVRDDEQLAYGVLRQDEELDALYAAEMERIFHNASNAMFYNFQTGTCLLFILRAIERIGDHAKQLAVPSFYLLTLNNNPLPAKKCAI